jgi:alkaline phosphatase D
MTDVSSSTPISRREFVRTAAALGAAAAWAWPVPARSQTPWTERRDLYPEGVASGDPSHDGVVLWTRRPGSGAPLPLTVEVAEDAAFSRVVARTRATARPEADWTVRVLVGGLAPAREYWYRFTDPDGAGSRIGRTITAPRDDDGRPARFAFVSCQDPSTGALNAWRRMIYEDERAAPADRLDFVLHLGDFVYEVVWYPEDRARYYDRKIKDLVRYPNGEKQGDLHVPTDVGDYRILYRAYLHDPDLQDARARWPFVAMWDNHEFSWRGWQSLQNFGHGNVPAQTRKVAANRAWWEYQPARITTPAGGAPASLEAFPVPGVSDAPVHEFDDHGLGTEPNNLAALASLTGYRALRYGRHLELIVTDQHSYRSEDPFSRPQASGLSMDEFPDMAPEEVMQALDGGRASDGGSPPAKIRFGETEIANFRAAEPPQTILGATQKAWFLDRLRASRATWKVWGNSQGPLDWRADPQNLPVGMTKPWPGSGYAVIGGGDWGTAYVERGEIYDAVAREGITGFACVAGDRHSFWAGLLAKALPPERFEPVGVAFITGSISAAGLVEAYEHRFPNPHPLRALYMADRPGAARPEPTVNMLGLHGVLSCLEYARSGDLARARSLSNPDNAPHLSFLDMGGHGYSVVTVAGDAMQCEFVCIPRPLEHATTPDGGPLRYRVVHRAQLWRTGELPRLEQRVVEGDPGLSI